MSLFDLGVNIAFVLSLGWYLIANLQWYDYKISRVVLYHHKKHWHFIYFLFPFLVYHFIGDIFSYLYIFVFLPSLIWWHYRLDQKLVITPRVKRFFALLLFFALFQNLVCYLRLSCEAFAVFIPLLLAYLLSYAIEKYLFEIYKKEASKRLASIKDLEIIAITGSYGKTSIKNFIASILSTKYRVYATPRSINTIGGIIKDVNTALPDDTQIYVCEAGARQSGDIAVIAEFLEPQRVVVGKVGLAHIEYFKTLRNIIVTKLEIMRSSRLKKAFVHSSVTDEPHEKVEFFGSSVYDLKADLDGLSFKMELDGEVVEFETSLLGSFQAINLEVAIKMAKEFKLSNNEIKEALLKLDAVPHRLQKIVAGGKIILDDGYNGNIDGMLEAIRLVSTHKGDKVIVTPGLVESSEELNLELAEAINGVFDTVIVTGKLNRDLFSRALNVKYKFILEDKSKLQDLLAKETKTGDIILFANDAPSFI
ncbi:MAG: UDP-N-acetylmuramoyl-tripeptide--D-alanyl-D-alanine ligase [Sulfuricurvum sp.]